MNRLSKATLLALSLLIVAPSALYAAARAETPQRAVLVSGTSSGIGRKIVERLVADGYFVYAGARKDADLQSLAAIRNVQAVRLDVTKAEDISAAVDTVKKGGRGLYGLVNNAGVFTYGTVTETKQEEFDLTMAVNVFGPWHLTRAFAPLITEQKGRIVNIGSISGIGVSGGGVYGMSKHTIEAFTDSLAQEMKGRGVKVSVIEPGEYSTDLYKNTAARGALGKYDSGDWEAGDPAEVASAVALALFEPDPKRRYLVVPNKSQAAHTIRWLMTQLVQLNEGHAYTYDREELIKILDEALVNSRPRRK